MASKVTLAVVLFALFALTYAEEPAKDVAEKPAKEEAKPEEGKKDDVEGRIGFGGYGGLGGGSSFGSGFNRQGFNTNRGGYNQGSGGFQRDNRYNNVQGFRNRDGYRTNQGFDVSDFNRYGSGGSRFNTGYNQGAGGGYNQYGQHQGGFLG
uniref:Putative glycine proline-rich secreted protein n=1 Tax=Ornithodoros turicata TaxID=34597 RepID=A0A2R5L7C9_9ACAR